MENWLNINQFRSIEWNLNSNEEKLCSYYSKDHKWVTTKILNPSGNYYCITINKLIQEIPTIGKTKPNFSRALNSLADKQIFDKYINENNQKEVYYRFNPVFLKAWKDNSKKVCSNFFTKTLELLNENNCYRNEIEELKHKQSVTEMKQSVTEMKPISINNNKQSIKQSDKHYDDDKSSKNIRTKNIQLEFEKILEIYPETVNNTKEKIVEAYGVFKTFNPAERFNVFKAVKNYSKTDNVKNQKTSKYIQSIHTFLTKSYTKFINGLPENYSYTEEFDRKKFEVGAEEVKEDKETSTLVMYKQNDIDKIKIFDEKFTKIKNIINEQLDYKIVEQEFIKMFSQKELEIILVKMGGYENIKKFESIRLSESLLDLIKADNE